MFTEDVEEGGYPFTIKEEEFYPDIKPFTMGQVTLRNNHNTRIYYRYEPDIKQVRIVDIVVEDSLRHVGLGRTMLTLAEKRFRELGAIEIVGYAEPALHSFWKQFGYQVDANNDIRKILK